MNINQTSKTSNSSDFLNQFFSINITEKKSFWYIIPGFSISEESKRDHQATIVDLAATLFGLKYPFGQIIVQISEQYAEKQNKTDKFFFWVKQPDHVFDTDFYHCVQKICDNFHIQSKCLIKLSNNQANIQISTADEVTKIDLETKQISEKLMSEFWPLFKNEHQQILEIRFANEAEAVHEPQTNLGRLARQLKANQMLEALNLP